MASAEWFLLKYVRDVRRREPVNLGVVLNIDGVWTTMFVGQKDDNTVDGRSARQVAVVDYYKAFIDYIHESITHDDPVGMFAQTTPDDSFYVERAGTMLWGEIDASDFISQLYAELVDSPSESRSDELAERIRYLIAESPLKDSPYFYRDRRVNFTPSSSRKFDYVWMNGSGTVANRANAPGERTVDSSLLRFRMAAEHGFRPLLLTAGHDAEQESEWLETAATANVSDVLEIHSADELTPDDLYELIARPSEGSFN